MRGKDALGNAAKLQQNGQIFSERVLTLSLAKSP